MLHEPFDEINRLRGRMRRLVDESFALPQDAAPRPRQWSPRADIHAAEERVVVSLEVPGMSEEDLEVTLEGRALTVTGRPAEEGRDAQEAHLHQERGGGAFTRAFTLGWEPKEYEARLKDGVLRVTVER